MGGEFLSMERNAFQNIFVYPYMKC